VGTRKRTNLTIKTKAEKKESGVNLSNREHPLWWKVEGKTTTTPVMD